MSHTSTLKNTMPMNKRVLGHATPPNLLCLLSFGSASFGTSRPFFATTSESKRTGSSALCGGVEGVGFDSPGKFESRLLHIDGRN